MTVRDLFAGSVVKLGYAVLSTTDAETAYFDFGTPDNLNLATTTAGQPGYGYRPGDRILVVLHTDSGGTTSGITLVVLDAPDSSGNIGSTAAATTDGTLLAGTGDKAVFTSVQVKAGRPWLKIGVTNDNATDTVVCSCSVYAIPRAGL